MELANFVASYILSVLTLIGLVVAIVFYFHQNKIILEKNKVDNFYRLQRYLLEIKYNDNIGVFLKNNTGEIHKPTDQFVIDRNINGLRNILITVNYITSQYNKDHIDKEMFDYHYRNVIVFLWIEIQNHINEIKKLNNIDVDIREYQIYISNQSIEYGNDLLELIKNLPF